MSFMDEQPNNMNTGEILIYQNLDGNIKIDVRLEEETVWLTQAQIALLFGKGRSTITEHIANVFKEGELEALSRSLLALYHDGHGGKKDIDLALEKWTLTI